MDIFQIVIIGMYICSAIIFFVSFLIFGLAFVISIWPID